jgi:hypothetical protein
VSAASTVVRIDGCGGADAHAASSTANVATTSPRDDSVGKRIKARAA